MTSEHYYTSNSEFPCAHGQAALTWVRLHLSALTYEGVLLPTEEVVRSVARPLIKEDTLLAGVPVWLALLPLASSHDPACAPLPPPSGRHEGGTHPEGVSCTHE